MAKFPIGYYPKLFVNISGHMFSDIDGYRLNNLQSKNRGEKAKFSESAMPRVKMNGLYVIFENISFCSGTIASCHCPLEVFIVKSRALKN